MSLIWRGWEHSEDENARWCHLRAIEWKPWPAFISQPIVPILFIFYPIQYVLIELVIINSLWILMRDMMMSVALASLGSIFVVITKWPACIIACVYLAYTGNYLGAVLSILWPFIGSFTGFMCVIGKGIGIYEIGFIQKLGCSFGE